MQEIEASDNPFPNNSKDLNSDSTASVEETYAHLVEHLVVLDPIKLLSILSLTYLTHRANTFSSEADEENRWVVRIELVAGILLARPYPSNPRSVITSADIDRLHELLELYERSLLTAAFHETSSDPAPDSQHVIGSVRNYSFWVRGTAYLHQYSAISRAIYTPHQDWFKTNLGFTIDEAMLLVESCIEEYNARINRERIAAQDYAVRLVSKSDSADTDKFLKFSIFYQRYYGRADEIVGFSIGDFSRVSGLSRERCERILARLSQEFGYHNPKYLDVFTDAKSARWDYNTLYERPFVRHGERYWMFLTAIIHPVLMTTFYYDLMGDNSYRSTFERCRGEWLEQKTADCLKSVFAHSEVFLNPYYENGNEMADVLVLYDHKALVVQCKSKGLTFEASRGRDFNQLKGSLEKSVQSAFVQGDRARQFLLANPRTTLHFKNSNLRCAIDTRQINRIHLVVVTAAPLQFLATRWASINSELDLFPDGDYPWCLSITDLEVLCEVLPNPVRFLHYVKRRFEIELGKQDVTADELDLLGVYLDRGLWFGGPKYKEFHLLGLAGMSKDVDEYMFRKYVLGESVELPSAVEPEGFPEFIAAIAESPDSYRSDIALAVLDLSGTARAEFMELIAQATKSAKIDGQRRSFNGLDGNSKAIAFVAMDAAGDHEVLYRELSTLAIRRARRGHCTEFYGIGWDCSTEKIVDATFYALFEPSDQGL